MSTSCVRMLDSRSNSANSRRRNSTPRQNTPPESSPPPTTFSKVTPIHGVGRISQGSLPVKFFYAGLVVAAIVTTVVFCAFLLEDIVSNPQTVTRTVKAKSSLDLPKITICNLNPLRQSSFDEFLQYVSDNDDDDSAETLYFGSGVDCPVCIDGEIDSDLFREKYSALPSNLKSAYGHQLSSMLLSCEFQGQACSESDFTSYVDDQYGNCFSFSSQSVNNYGAVSGLVLELDAEPNEYLPQASETVGVRVLLEPQATPSCLKYDDLAVSPGQDNFISLKSALATGPCAKNYVTVSGGVWPTSASKSRSLLSSATSGGGTSISGSPGGATTTPPDLDAVDGSGGGSPGGVVGFVDVGEEYNRHILSKREAEAGDRFTTKEKVPSKHNVDIAPSVLQQTENREIFQYQNANTENKDTGTNGNYDIESTMQNNKNLDWEYYKERSMQYTEHGSDVSASYYGHLERVRRDASEETNETTLTDAESVDSARDRFSKVRVFYSSMDEEVESESKVYPWYVATALIGGQLALLCSISAVAIIEGIECFVRFVGRKCRQLKPDNKIGIRNAWD